jgi:hypothetical protein
LYGGWPFLQQKKKLLLSIIQHTLYIIHICRSPLFICFPKNQLIPTFICFQ